MTKQISTPEDVKQLGTILAVWAHPDDESFCAAGILATAVNNGQRVICLTATKGEAGVQDEKRWPAKKLGSIRSKELAASLKLLGIDDHHCLDYADGGCHELPDEEGSKVVKAFIDTHMPQTILTFGPDGLTGHNDHQAVSRWVSQAVKGTAINVFHFVQEKDSYEHYMKQLDKQFNFYFNIDQPPLCSEAECAIALRLTPELIKQKCAALKAMPSQTEAMFKKTPQDLIEAAFGCECFVPANK